jgi:hypothetical protein
MWNWLSNLLHLEKQADTLRGITDDPLASQEIKELNAFYAIDTRTTSYFTIGSAILPIVAGFLSSDQNPLSNSAVAKWALFLGFAFYVLLAVFYVWSFLYTGWDSRPEVEQWKTVTTQFTVGDLQRWLGDACVEAYSNNEPVIEREANKSALALWCLAGEVICLSTAVLAPLWPLW